jgi:N-glycosylase/DNA lyase
MNDLKNLYAEIKNSIDVRLAEFDAIWERGDDAEIFAEMAFCLCTPQTNAHYGDIAVKALVETGYLWDGHEEQIACILKDSGVRFHKNKANHIVRCRGKYLVSTKEKLEDIMKHTVRESRNSLAMDVTGWGLKEASHFLRNVGFGAGVCILDRHILRCLSDYDVVSAIPKVLTSKLYLDIEEDMVHFAAEVDIPVEALDFVFWYRQKGEIFK